MRRFKNLVIGGIQSKVFNLILLTVLLLGIASLAFSLYQNSVLTRLADDSRLQQQESIGNITGQVMDSVVETSLARSGRTGAAIFDSVFRDEANRVNFLARRAAELFAHPKNYPVREWSVPDPENDGTWTAKVIFSEGVRPEDPAIAAKLGLVFNLSEDMISLMRSYDADALYIGMPEGLHLTVGDSSSGWIEDGSLLHFDPRSRGWYQAAVSAGQTVFFDREQDVNTGAYCIECACPVFGPDGSLQAVVGADLYLDDLQQALADLSLEGERYLLVNQDGRVVPGPQADTFPLSGDDRERDLREAKDSLLSQAVSAALQGKETPVMLGDLSGSSYYLTAAPISSTGWVLLSAFPEENAKAPISMLQEGNARIQAESAAAYQSSMDRLHRRFQLLTLLVVVLTLCASVILGKRIVKPLNTIVARISELREGNLEFKMEDVYRTGDEVEELAESFAALSHKTVEYVDTVKKVTAEKERIGTELSLATRIQAAMLPHIFPAFPDRKEFDIYASMDPAREVGGDFYDYFLIDPDHLGIVIADVSGKGVPAALFMMACKIILQSVAMMGKSPAEILTRTNNAVCSTNDAEMFVTVWLGILDLKTGRLTAASAGHEYPMVKQPNGRFELFRDKHGFVIGGMEGVRYQEYELQMEPGSKLFVYTDGVPEATNADEEPFGTTRLQDALNVCPDASPADVLKNVRAAVDSFVRDAEQFDDLTMLCVEYRGNQGLPPACGEDASAIG